MVVKTTLCIAGLFALSALGCKTSDNNPSNTTGTDNTDTNVRNTSGTVENPANTPSARGNNAPKQNDPIAQAENHDKVKQYPDEVKMSPTPVKIVTGEIMFVREDSNGRVANETIDRNPHRRHRNRGRAQRTYYLVLYPDPNDTSKQMAGWVYKDALESSAWPIFDTETGKMTPPPSGQGAKNAPEGEVKPAKLSCKGSEKEVHSNTDLCATECKKDDDCKSASGLCDGVAHEVKGDKITKSVVRYCVNEGKGNDGTQR